LTVRHHARAIDYDDYASDQPEIFISEEHWSQEDGWQYGDIVDSAEWRYTVDSTGTMFYEPADAVLSRMGWQRESDWVDVGFGFFTTVKPLALF